MYTAGRNLVKRCDEENKDHVACLIAAKIAKRRRMSETDLTCPPPLFPEGCLLLFTKDESYRLRLYISPDDDAPKIIPQGEYAFVCIYNAEKDVCEFRCGAATDGMNIHLVLSGNADGVECAGKICFGDDGQLVFWNIQSGSYRPGMEHAAATGLPMDYFQKLPCYTSPSSSDAEVELPVAVDEMLPSDPSPYGSGSKATFFLNLQRPGSPITATRSAPCSPSPRSGEVSPYCSPRR